MGRLWIMTDKNMGERDGLCGSSETTVDSFQVTCSHMESSFLSFSLRSVPMCGCWTGAIAYCYSWAVLPAEMLVHQCPERAAAGNCGPKDLG